MLTCSQFTIHRYEVKISNLNIPIPLYLFGDVHRFARGCAVEKWLDFLNRSRKDKNALFLGMGDYDDLASASERAILINPDLHEETQFTIEDIYNERCKQFANEIAFMRGRLIGLIEGNHYGTFSSGITTTQKLCEMLKCQYLGVNSFIRLVFTYGEKSTSIDIFAHHGRGAARLLGSSLNTVEQMVSVAEADIYVMGHDHQMNTGKINRLHLSGNNGLRLKDKTSILARSGSFLRGYFPNHSSYVVKGNMKPSALGETKIIITPTRYEPREAGGKRKDYFYVKLNSEI